MPKKDTTVEDTASEAVKEPEASETDKKEEKTKKRSSKGSKTQKAKYEEEINSLKEQLDKQKEELEKQKEVFMRTAAEYDNYRKRTEREKTNIYNDATASTIQTMLPVLDSLERAIESLNGADDEHAKGLNMIMAQMQDSLKKLNVESYGARGDDFNPELHNAVAQIDDPELEENQVAAVFQKGYKIGDKIIRHAMVQVAC